MYSYIYKIIQYVDISMYVCIYIYKYVYIYNHIDLWVTGAHDTFFQENAFDMDDIDKESGNHGGDARSPGEYFYECCINKYT